MKIPYLSTAIRRKLRLLDRDMKIGGLVGAMKKLAIRNASQPVINLNNKTLRVLVHNPVLVIANHPHEAETLALLASLPHRKDVYMVISSLFLNLAPNADTYFIPVYIDHHSRTDKQRKLSTRISSMFHKPSNLTIPEATNKNILSIKKAVNKINSGNLVVYFPMGGRGKHGKWFDGVGYLLQGIKQKNAYIVMSYIHGTSHLDYLRLLPGIRKLMPKIYVYFSPPKKIANIMSVTSQPKLVKNKLEKNYNGWVRSIRNKYKLTD